MISEVVCKGCKCVLPSTFKFCPKCGREVSPEVSAKAKRRPRGSGTIFKLKGKRAAPWVVKKDGKLLGYYPDFPSAEKFLASQQDKNPSKTNTTLTQIHDHWKSMPSYKKLADGTKDNHRISWDKLHALHNKPIRKLKASDYQEAIDTANGAGCGRDGCSKLKTLISLLCEEAMKDDIIDRNYSTSIELPEYVQTVKRRNVTDEEILTLLYNDDNRDVRIILTMLYSSTRIDELLSIEKTNVHIDEGYMIGGSKSEAGKNRTIPIRTEIVPYVQSFLLEKGKKLISSPTGKKLNPNNWRSRAFYPTLELVGINYKDEEGNNVITPHRMRHTYIAESIKAGISPDALIKIVGHSKFATSNKHYNKEVDVEYLRKEAAKGL